MTISYEWKSLTIELIPVLYDLITILCPWSEAKTDMGLNCGKSTVHMPVREDQSTIKGQTSDILNFAAKLVRLNIGKSCYTSLLTNETPRHTSYILIFHENLTILSFYKYLSGQLLN